IACEERLMQAYREDDFPVTIVRPSHTYDKTMLPFRGNYTMLDRMQKGKKVVVHGDGTSLWTLTHHRDFAKGFIGLLGNTQSIGHSVHITSDEVLSWNQIFSIMAKAAGGGFNPVYIPSKTIAGFDQDWGASLLGDKSHSMIFDNTKVKRLVPGFKATIPFSEGASEIVDWYTKNPGERIIEKEFNKQLEQLIAKFG
ncbi:MAG: NAD-dependent epimerase/dehydratase family protein, partial [Balneolaceae bacterium]